MLKPVVRKDFIQRTQLAYRENARLSEDFLYLVDFFAAGGNGILTGEPLYNWTQPFGTVSRRWTTTGTGDWRYNYESALEAYAEALHELRSRDEKALSAMLAKRISAYKQLHRLNKLNQLRRSGASYSQLAAEALHHPSIWRHLLAHLINM